MSYLRENRAWPPCLHGQALCMRRMPQEQRGARELRVLAAATSKNPAELAAHMIDENVIYPNGPEHHTLIGVSLLVVFANAGGSINKEQGLAELRKHILNVPGGTCDFWGTSGVSVVPGNSGASSPARPHDNRHVRTMSEAHLQHLGKAGGAGRSSLLQTHRVACVKFSDAGAWGITRPWEAPPRPVWFARRTTPWPAPVSGSRWSNGALCGCSRPR